MTLLVNYRILKAKQMHLYSTKKTRSMFLHGEIHIPKPLFFPSAASLSTYHSQHTPMQQSHSPQYRTRAKATISNNRIRCRKNI